MGLVYLPTFTLKINHMQANIPYKSILWEILKKSPKISQRHCQPKWLLLKNIVQLGLGSTCLLLEDHLLPTDLSHLRSPWHPYIHHISWFLKVIKNSQTECLRCTNHLIHVFSNIFVRAQKQQPQKFLSLYSFAIPELFRIHQVKTATKTHDGYASVHPPGSGTPSTRRHHRVTSTKFTW